LSPPPEAVGGTLGVFSGLKEIAALELASRESVEVALLLSTRLADADRVALKEESNEGEDLLEGVGKLLAEELPLLVPCWACPPLVAVCCTLGVRTKLGVERSLGLGTRESVEEGLLLPPTRLMEGKAEVEGEREVDRVTVPLPLEVPISALPVKETVEERMGLELMLEVELALRDKVTEGEGVKEGEDFPESVDALLALGLPLLVPYC